MIAISAHHASARKPTIEELNARAQSLCLDGLFFAFVAENVLLQSLVVELNNLFILANSFQKSSGSAV